MSTTPFGFSAETAAWLQAAFDAPTPAQSGAWQAVSEGQHTLVVAPTGSGKTLAAFLAAIDRISSEPSDIKAARDKQHRCRVVYISPLKALASDIERNLRSPLTGIEQEFLRTGRQWPGMRVGIRTGDTPQAQRAELLRNPPDILITTPESLYLMLTSRARDILQGVDTVIIDEVHALAGGKRGAHLALSLARLDSWSQVPIQRIGLSATVRPLSAVATWLSPSQPVCIVNPPMQKQWDLHVVVPVEDMADTTATNDSLDAMPVTPSIWPHVDAKIAEVVAAHRSTIVFANSRRLAERLTQRLNDIAAESSVPHAREEPRSQLHEPVLVTDVLGELGVSAGETGVVVDVDKAVPAHSLDTDLRAVDDLPATRGSDSAAGMLARAHHGSVSKELRADIEDALKRGDLKAVVATSSLELGIDMGAVDVVIQVESPPSVASGLQRVGRAGHQVGAISRGVLFPKFRGDLVQCAVVAERMRAGLIEELRVPRNALDVLAQQVVAIVAMDDIAPETLFELVRSTAGYTELPRSAFDAVLDMLAGRYAHDEYAELRPRILWDRDADLLSARDSSQRLAVTNAGTIPDRGLFPVLMVGERRTRVGELDEEMVYESRVGDVFSLGTSSWRIEDITHDTVYVSPAPGQPGKLPFWKGDTLGRPLELGQALGAFIRELETTDSDAAEARLTAIGLDDNARHNLVSYIHEQSEVTGFVPHDRNIVMERTRDELGDWRVIIHSPFGAAVHAPWALLISAHVQERFGFDAQVSHADDGIVLRIPDFSDEFDPIALYECIIIEPELVEQQLTDLLMGSAVFAARFRECAGRALLLPKRDPRRRSPLWQQRQRSAQLLAIASKYSTFPILLETMREVTQDLFDVPGLRWLMQSLGEERIQLTHCETELASPFARSLLFGYVAQFLYEGDNPLAERRAAALTLDAQLLTELLGTANLSDLLDPDVIASVHADLQRLSPERQVRSLDQGADLFRLLGPLTHDAAIARGLQPEWLAELLRARRLIEVRIAGQQHVAAIEDSGRLRDGLGVALPTGIPTAYTDVVEQPLHDLVARWARTRGPFTRADLATSFGLSSAVVTLVAEQFVTSRRWQAGAFVAGAEPSQYCDSEVVRQIRRRNVAALRQQAEPVAQQAFARFLPQWHGCNQRRRGMSGLISTIEQLQGYPIAASQVESAVLPSRVLGYQGALLDELLLSGELIWVGRGALPGDDGWLSLLPAGSRVLPHASAAEFTPSELHGAVLEIVGGAGAWLYRDIEQQCRERGISPTPKALGSALWDLVWAGYLSTNTFAPVRAAIRKTTTTQTRTPRLGGRRQLGSSAVPMRLSGRWFRVDDYRNEDTRTRAGTAEQMLLRHGVLTGPAVGTERSAGGWSQTFPVLTALEERGRARRTYAIEGLGGSQFATVSAIDELRNFNRDDLPREAFVLAATDAANPYGAALSWPAHPHLATGHRPGRKVGAFVVLVDGQLVLYVERGGKSLLCFDHDIVAVSCAARALAQAVRRGLAPALRIDTIDSVDVVTASMSTAASAIASTLESEGFTRSPRGLLIREG